MPSRLARKSGGEWRLVRYGGGGLNELSPAFEVPEGECSELLNFRFLPQAWERRPGCMEKLDILEESNIRSLFVTTFTSLTNYLLVFTGDRIYRVDFSAANWEAELLTVDVSLTVGQRWDVVQMGEVVYMTNGADRLLKWRGGDGHVEQVGISAPTDGNMSFGGSGDCTAGDHGVRITWYNNNAGTESNYKDLGTKTSGGAEKLSITGVTASTDPQVTHLRIYMTVADGSTYYLAASIAIGGTYEASIADSTLEEEASMQAIVDEADADLPPTKCKYITAAKRRLYVGNIFRDGASRPDEIQWSEQVGLDVTEPEYFPVLNNRKAQTNGGQITRLISWGDYVYIFHTKGISVLTDPSAPDMSPIMELNLPGNISPFSVCTGRFKRPVPVYDRMDIKQEEFELVEGMIYRSGVGIMGFDGTRTYPLSEKIMPSLDNIAASADDEVTGHFYDGNYYLSYGSRLGSAGEEATYRDFTTDSGGEVINAVDDGTDALNYLVHNSKSDRGVKAGLHIDLNHVWKKSFGIQQLLVSVTFDVFSSADNGATWGRRVRQTVTNEGHLDGTAQEYYEYSFLASGVNAVKVEYVSSNYGPLNIQLLWVEYLYDPEATIVNNRMLFYNSMVNGWSRYKGWKAGCFAIVEIAGQERMELFGESDNGRILRMNVGTADEGEPIFAHLVTGYTDGKFPEVKKRWFECGVQMDLGGDVVNFLAYVDRLETAKKELNLIPSGERETYYGEAEYGEGHYEREEGIKDLSVNFEPNAGYRCCEEFWSSSREGLIIRNRILRFVKRE